MMKYIIAIGFLSVFASDSKAQSEISGQATIEILEMNDEAYNIKMEVGVEGNQLYITLGKKATVNLDGTWLYDAANNAYAYTESIVKILPFSLGSIQKEIKKGIPMLHEEQEIWIEIPINDSEQPARARVRYTPG